MTKIKQFLKDECRGWKIWEILWLFLATVIIIGLSLYWHDTLIGIISATSGVICVVCTGKGKLSAYIWGLINSVLYALISYKASYYGETMLNALYYVPMQFVGFYVWAKNINPKTYEVKKRHMDIKGRIVVIASIGILTWAYGFGLEKLGDAMPYVDSFTTICSVVAMIVSVKMFSEQWWIWVAVNVFSVYMWWVNFTIGNENISTLVMWSVYLINSIIMLIKWESDIAKNKGENL